MTIFSYALCLSLFLQSITCVEQDIHKAADDDVTSLSGAAVPKILDSKEGQDQDEKFREFQAKYNKQYECPDEYQKRYKVTWPWLFAAFCGLFKRLAC